jgi:adenylate cyclase 1
MAARLKWIYWDVAQSFSLRLAITVFTIILIYTVGQMNVVSSIDFLFYFVTLMLFFIVNI